MNSQRSYPKPLLWLAMAAAVALVLIMLKLFLFQQQIFGHRYALSLVEWIIALEFLLVAVFVGLSIIWLLRRIYVLRTNVLRHKVILMLGLVCVPLFLGQKTMIDEIAREYALGWEPLGEWIIMYLFLAIQLGYCLIFLRTLINNRMNSRV
jgi:hypothetical protein